MSVNRWVKVVCLILQFTCYGEDLWVLPKPYMTMDLSRFCTSEKLSHPLSVDPTFNFGKFEVTLFFCMVRSATISC